MSNTTKTVMVVTEMVAEMKLGNRSKEDNAEEVRRLRSRRKNYTINEKTAIKKKIKSCREVPLQIKMEKGNNLRIFCSTTAFEKIRKIIIETIASNYALDKTENRDISGKVVIEHIQDHQHTTNKWTPSTKICERYYQYYNHGQMRMKRK